jgi:hypothetical protein
MTEILIKDFAGTFAENKDVARKLRVKQLMPALKKRQDTILDFSGVTGATQSFMHALLSEAIRQYGDSVFELVAFKNCSPVVKEVITIVTEYMQES